MIEWLTGNARKVLRGLPEKSISCVITSPPYFGLRSYDSGKWVGGDPKCDHKKLVNKNSSLTSGLTGGKATVGCAKGPVGNTCRCGATRTNEIWGGKKGCKHVWGKARSIAVGNAPSTKSKLHGGLEKMRSQATETTSGSFCTLCNAWMGELGNEPKIEQYVSHLVSIFRAVRRVLKDDGVLFLNLGDSYSGSSASGGDGGKNEAYLGNKGISKVKAPELGSKNLMMVPARVAIALQADGWIIRSEIVWWKRNQMPESSTDRPTRTHEMIYMLTKKPTYKSYFDAIKEPCMSTPGGASFGKVTAMDNSNAAGAQSRRQTKEDRLRYIAEGRNIRTVWDIPTASLPLEHFAPFPQKLVQRCLLAATKKGDKVIDPFSGSGTVQLVAEKMGRDSVYIDLNPKFMEMAKRRILTEKTGGTLRPPKGTGFFTEGK